MVLTIRPSWLDWNFLLFLLALKHVNGHQFYRSHEENRYVLCRGYSRETPTWPRTILTRNLLVGNLVFITKIPKIWITKITSKLPMYFPDVPTYIVLLFTSSQSILLMVMMSLGSKAYSRDFPFSMTDISSVSRVHVGFSPWMAPPLHGMDTWLG